MYILQQFKTDIYYAKELCGVCPSATFEKASVSIAVSLQVCKSCKNLNIFTGEICCENIKDKEKGKVLERLTPLSLAYDITPPDFVSAVVTELAVLPCTSVPVILRIKPSESVM